MQIEIKVFDIRTEIWLKKDLPVQYNDIYDISKNLNLNLKLTIQKENPASIVYKLAGRLLTKQVEHIQEALYAKAGINYSYLRRKRIQDKYRAKLAIKQTTIEVATKQSPDRFNSFSGNLVTGENLTFKMQKI